MRKEEMLELIKKADEAYYMEDNPIMTDAEYDKLRYDFIAKYGELNYLKMILESLGYKVTNSVSKNTTFLLCGDINSTKAKKAKALGVKILTEIDIQENQI